MERRLEGRLELRGPGNFEHFARIKAKDNETQTRARKLTHLQLVCLICDKEMMAPIDSAASFGQAMDKHTCKPDDQWPPDPKASTRGNPTERPAMYRRMGQEHEGE
jgi:hypothetical protein